MYHIISPPPVKPEGTIALHSVCHTRFPDYSLLRFHISGWKLATSFYMKSYRLSSTFVTVDLLFHELLPSVQNFVRHTSFLDFSSLCFHISGWKLVASFCMKSYRSSLTFVTVDILFHELLSFVQNSVHHNMAMFEESLGKYFDERINWH